VGIVITRLFATEGNVFSKVSQLGVCCCLCKPDCRIKVKENRTQTIFPLLLYAGAKTCHPSSLLLEDYSSCVAVRGCTQVQRRAIRVFKDYSRS